MIIKGRSPTTRQLLWIGCFTGLIRTPRSKSVTLTPNINSRRHFDQRKYHTWWVLLHLFKISHFSSNCCTKNISVISCSTMAKRIQEQKEEERVVSKSRLTAMNLSSSITTSFSTASSPTASKSPVMLTASGKPDSRMSVEPNSFDAASTSQVRLKDAYLGGLKEKQRRNPSHQEDSEDSNNPEAEICDYKGKEVTEEPIAHGARSSVDK